MNGRPAVRRLALMALVITLVGPSLRGQDPLNAAKELYAQASYEEALAALERLKAGAPAPMALEIDQYRAFCLFALGRTQEAEAVAESLVRANPLVDLRSEDTSPRIVALFVDLQKRMLPSLIRDRYRVARASMEEADAATTEAELSQVQRMLAKAKSVGAWDEALADMSILVEGFLELSRSTAQRRAASAFVAPEPAATPAAATPAAATPAAATPAAATPAAATLAAATPAAAAPVAPAPAASSPPVAAPETPAAPARPAVYSALDTHVTAPVALQQVVPRVPANLALSMRASKRTGVLEVTIDERGQVETAFIRESVNPVFDGLVVAATRTWQYQPAKLEGVPVRYLKRIAFALQ